MYISRISSDGREQPTLDHLRETAEYASMLGSKFNLPTLTHLAALLHDMGKYSSQFVKYLRLSANYSNENGVGKPSRGSVIHTTQGAKFIHEIGFNDKNLMLAAEIASICIAGHHGGLMDCISPEGNTPLSDRLATNKKELDYEEVINAFKQEYACEDIWKLVELSNAEVMNVVTTSKDHNLNPGFMLQMLVRSVFSCVVDADRYNAYCFDIGCVPETHIQTPPWDEYARRLEGYISSFNSDSEIARIRKDISEKCLAASMKPRGIYRLHVPTGGGKTLSSLRFALNHAKKNNMQHVIYVIPYLSVLEQAADQIRKALQLHDDEDFILEHHSNYVQPDNEEQAQSYRLLTDRWSQPIIITTLVQFLESIFSHKASDLRKLHNMANSILIFDEVQSLPIKTVHLFNDALNYLHFFGKSTVLLCTATQPLIDKVRTPIYLSTPSDLIDDTSDFFKKLKRTQVRDCTIRGGYTIEQLRDFVVDKLTSSGNCLVILNTKATASALYTSVQEYLDANPDNQVKLVHLSTSMCPAHRLDVLDDMQEIVGNKKVLKNERILCISTQLIEAGVDISFNCVVRALAGLDSIMQAAGRCNRHGEAPNGRDVYIVNLAEENLSKLPDIKCGSDITYRILTESVNELQCQAVMERFYREYFYKRKDEMDYLCNHGSIYDLLSSNKKGFYARSNFCATTQPPALRHAYQTAGETFCVIDQNTTSVLVPYKRGIELIEELPKASVKDKARLFREIGRYSVSLYQHQIKRLDEQNALYYVDDNVLVLDKDYYDCVSLGVVFKSDPAFLLV